jgi:predicted CoA-substrate-specific enzyme activase
VDVGSRTAKAVIMRGNQISGSSVMLREVDPVHSAQQIIEKALKTAKVSWEHISYIIATGYGRLQVPFAHSHVTEITCHARGASHLFPDIRTVLDIGGQDCKAIRLDENGRLLDFFMNDKCAAGTGRCLERIAAAIGVQLDDIGPLSLKPVKEPLRVDTYCAVFAQMDVISLVNEGKDVSDIMAAVLDGFASRIWGMLERIEVQPELCISGGVAKNIGIVSRIEQRMGRKVRVAPEPEIVGALGAALIAQDKLAATPQEASRSTTSSHPSD